MNNTNDTAEKPKDKINIYDVILLIAKSILVLILAFLSIFALDAAMSKHITREREKQERISGLLRQQEDYDRANEVYPIADHYDGQFQEIFEKRVNADYIFIGTSHFTHGVTPEEFEVSGKKFFNFALNGSNPSYYVWWYNDVFKANRYVKPKAIIVGVDWFMFDTDWLWRKPDFDYRYITNKVSRDPPGYEAGEGEGAQAGGALRYRGAWYDIDGIVTYITNRFAVFSSREKFIDLALPIKNNENEEELAFVKKEREQQEFFIDREGFVLSSFYKGFVPWENNFGGHHAGTARTNFKTEEEAAFLKLLKQFKDEDIPLVFVMAPEYLPGREAPQFERMTEIISQIAAERGIPFLNYNTELISEINEDYTMYSDWGHLNGAGAHKFSKMLYEDLNKISFFDK